MRLKRTILQHAERRMHLGYRLCEGLRGDVHVEVRYARCPASDGCQPNPWEYVSVVSLANDINGGAGQGENGH